MIAARLAAVGVAIGALYASDGGAAPAAKARPMDPIRVQWQLARDDAHHQLAVTYTVTNTGTDPVVLLDQLVVPSSKGLEPAFDRVIVKSVDADTVAFVRGYVAPTQPIGGVYPPGARDLAPGKSVTGQATIALPLAGWHNFAPPPTLPGTAKHVVLQIGYLVGHTKWGEVALTDGSRLRVPNPPYVATQQLAAGETKSLP